MREAGFYWVKRWGEWLPAEWNAKWWSLPGTDECFWDRELDEIDDRRIERPE